MKETPVLTTKVLLHQSHTSILSNLFSSISKIYLTFNFQFISQLKPDSTIDQCKLMMQPQEHLISTLLQFPLLVFTSSYCLRKLNVRGCDGLKPSALLCRSLPFVYLMQHASSAIRLYIGVQRKTQRSCQIKLLPCLTRRQLHVFLLWGSMSSYKAPRVGGLSLLYCCQIMKQITKEPKYNN